MCQNGTHCDLCDGGYAKRVPSDDAERPARIAGRAAVGSAVAESVLTDQCLEGVADDARAVVEGDVDVGGVRSLKGRLTVSK